MLLTIAIAVWTLVVVAAVALRARARRASLPRHTAAERIHALRRVAPGCGPAGPLYVRPRQRRRGGRRRATP